MRTSETLGEFAKAMAKVQTELKPAQKNATNPFLKNKYADLGAVIEACQELAGRNGLATVQMPFTVQGGMGITTRIIHTSGEWVEGEVTFELAEERGISNAQSAGKLLTYARRYALAAAFGVVADDDTDGNVETVAKPQAKAQPKAQPAQAEKPTGKTFADGEAVTVKALPFFNEYFDAWGELPDSAESLRQWIKDKKPTPATIDAPMEKLLGGLISELDKADAGAFAT